MGSGDRPPFRVTAGFYLAGVGVTGLMRMGFCGHIGRNWLDDPQDYIDAVTYAGGRVIREDVTWSRVEPTLGNYGFPGANADLARMDATMTLAQAADIETLVILDYGNSLYGPDSPAGYKGGLVLTEAERSGFANYAGFLAGALVGRQAEYEIWNEWNVPLGATAAQVTAQEHLDPLKYHAMQAVTYPAVKAADPSAFVWAGGFAEPYQSGAARADWIKAYLAIPGWEQTVDGFSFHHYLNFTAPELWFAQIRGIAQQARAAAISKPDLPVAITESGWFNGTDPFSVSESLAADYYSRWPLLLRCSGINKAAFYNLRNDGASTGKEDNFGVFSTTYAPKPAADALADVLPAVHAAQTAEYWADNQRHVVAMNDGAQLGAWATSGAPVLRVSVNSPIAGFVQIKEAGGATSSVSVSAGVTEIEVTLAQRSKIITTPTGARCASFE